MAEWHKVAADRLREAALDAMRVDLLSERKRPGILALEQVALTGQRGLPPSFSTCELRPSLNLFARERYGREVPGDLNLCHDPECTTVTAELRRRWL